MASAVPAPVEPEVVKIRPVPQGALGKPAPEPEPAEVAAPGSAIYPKWLIWFTVGAVVVALLTILFLDHRRVKAARAARSALPVDQRPTPAAPQGPVAPPSPPRTTPAPPLPPAGI